MATDQFLSTPPGTLHALTPVALLLSALLGQPPSSQGARALARPAAGSGHLCDCF